MNPNILIAAALFVVVVILVAGLFTLFREGPEARNMSNRLMRYRVLVQAVALLIILAVLFFNLR